MAIIRPGSPTPNNNGVRRGLHRSRTAYLSYLAGGGGSVDYSTWIALDLDNAIASYDSGSILGSASTTSAVTTVAITGTGGSDSAWKVFHPKDSAGNIVDLRKFGVTIFFDFASQTQPTAGSDISILFGIVKDASTQPDAGANTWYAMGGRWDASGNGPDLISARTGTFHATGASSADAAGKLQIRLAPPAWNGTADYEPRLNAHAEWYALDGSVWWPDRVRTIATPNVDLGTPASAMKLIFGIYEGTSAETISFKAHYRVYPVTGDFP
jgi:hypothetical protein